MKLLRVLLPSWRFFDGPIQAPELFFRIIDDSELPNSWEVCISKPPARTLRKLFVNTMDQYYLAAHSLIEYFKNDLDEGVDSRTSLMLIENLVRYEMNCQSYANKKIQFMLAYHDTDSSPLYLSSVLDVK